MQQEILGIKEKCLMKYSSWGTGGKLVHKSYRDFREYRWKQSWSKRSRKRHAGSSSWPKPIQMKKIFTRRQSLRIFSGITTRPWRILGRRHTWQTGCRLCLWVTLFLIKGSGDSSFRSFSAQEKIETAAMNSVRRNYYWNGLCSVHTE